MLATVRADRAEQRLRHWTHRRDPHFRANYAERRTSGAEQEGQTAGVEGIPELSANGIDGLSRLEGSPILVLEDVLRTLPR